MNLTYYDQSDAADNVTFHPISVQSSRPRREPLMGVYVALLLFMLIYFSRPGDWIPGLWEIPLAKITGILAFLGLALSFNRFRQRWPRETIYLFLLIGQLFIASLVSPVWRGGAVGATLTFAKVLMIVPLITAAVTTSRRLRWLIFTQAISVAAIAAVVIWKRHLLGGRLDGILGGNYGDPNDMALAIILVLPMCLALLFLTRNWVWKAFWSISMLVMTYAVFLTGSRGGFVSLVVVTGVTLWQFAIRGRRHYLLFLTALAGLILAESAGGMMVARLKGTFDAQEDTEGAYGSAQSRQQLFWKSIELTVEYPLFGVGPGNFEQVSGQWHTTHNSLTLMSSEGGIPAFILYSLILWCGFKNVRATIRLARGHKEMTILARALCASLAGYAVGSLFLSWAFLYLPYILVAYTTALLSIARKARKAELDQQAVDEKKVPPNATAAEMFFPNFTDPATSAS